MAENERLERNFSDTRTFLTDDLQGRSQRIENNSDIGNRLPAYTDTFPISLLERQAMNRTNSGVKLACVASVYAWFKSKKRPRNGIFGHGRARDLQFFTTPSPLFYSRHFSRGPCSLFRCHSDMCIPVTGVSPYTYPQ